MCFQNLKSNSMQGVALYVMLMSVGSGYETRLVGCDLTTVFCCESGSQVTPTTGHLQNSCVQSLKHLIDFHFHPSRRVILIEDCNISAQTDRLVLKQAQTQRLDILHRRYSQT